MRKRNRWTVVIGLLVLIGGLPAWGADAAAAKKTFRIAFPGGKLLGDPNVTLRFDPTYVQLAAEGTL